MFKITNVKPVLNLQQVAMDQLIEIIRANGKEKLLSSLNELLTELNTITHFNGIPSSFMIEAVNNITYFDFFPDDAEKLDYSPDVEKELLQILDDDDFHAKLDLLERLNEHFGEDITREFSETIRKLSANNTIMKFDKNKNKMESVGRGTGKYSYLKIKRNESDEPNKLGEYVGG